MASLIPPRPSGHRSVRVMIPIDGVNAVKSGIKFDLLLVSVAGPQSNDRSVSGPCWQCSYMDTEQHGRV